MSIISKRKMPRTRRISSKDRKQLAKYDREVERAKRVVVMAEICRSISFRLDARIKLDRLDLKRKVLRLWMKSKKGKQI